MKDKNLILNELKYKPFLSNEIKPSGWLRRQLEMQAKGLSGNLHKIWPDIRDSAWIGGIRDGWERVPYWLDGFIPMAYMLDNKDLISVAERYIEAILDRRQKDGWLCPCSYNDRGNYDMWAYLLICKVLSVYADCSGDLRIIAVLEKAFNVLDHHLDQYKLFGWGKSRWFEGLISIYWLYEKTGSETLLELALKLKNQGTDWETIIKSEQIKHGVRTWTHETHIVNINMMLKSDALISRITCEDADRFAKIAVETLDCYHSMAAGCFTGDECVAGDSPIQGTELCGIVEGMYSYEKLLEISGNFYWAERLESLAFNALPAAISSDMWTHQYDQMTNQVECAPMPSDKVVFMTNGNLSHTFGIEPNFGCCTANFSQGWSKFAQSVFMRDKSGIVSAVLAPSILNTIIDDTDVCIELITDYPFRNKLIYQVITSDPIEFELKIRIPSSATGCVVNGKNVFDNKNNFNETDFISVKHIWEGSSTVTVEFEFKTEFIKRPNEMVCVKYGPLIFSVAIDEEWERIESVRDGESIIYPYCDFYVHPLSKWNYAFVSDEFKLIEHDFDIPFSAVNPPLSLMADMAEIPWSFANGVCAAVPDNLEAISEKIKVKLIPYGCTNLRITEVPFINR